MKMKINPPGGNGPGRGPRMAKKLGDQLYASPGLVDIKKDEAAVIFRGQSGVTVLPQEAIDAAGSEESISEFDQAALVRASMVIGIHEMLSDKESRHQFCARHAIPASTPGVVLKVALSEAIKPLLVLTSCGYAYALNTDPITGLVLLGLAAAAGYQLGSDIHWRSVIKAILMLPNRGKKTLGGLTMGVD